MENPINQSATHTIRLRHPWEKTLRVRGPDATPLTETSTVRVNVPEPTENLSQHIAVYQRRFNRPTSLTSNCIVRLEVLSWQGELTSLSVNQTQLPVESSSISTEITGLLQAQNLIRIELHPRQDQLPQMTGAVRLVIQTQNAPSQ
jgi:hypothetical protein